MKVLLYNREIEIERSFQRGKVSGDAAFSPTSFHLGVCILFYYVHSTIHNHDVLQTHHKIHALTVV